MTANTLTGLIPTIYKAADWVLREQVGFIPAVFINAAAEQVAENQNITYPIVPTMSASAISPAMVPTEPSGMTIGYGQMSISKYNKVPFVWRGEEQAAIGSNYDVVLADQFKQAFRTLVNDIEADLFAAAKTGASRAYGTAGTTPFGTAGNLSHVAQVRKILADNGAWTSDMHLVLNTTSGANIRGLQSSLFKVNEAGDDALLRDGRLGDLHGFALHESNQIALHTKGTGTGYKLSVGTGAGGIGSTTFAVGGTGATGTILAGDILTNTKTGRDSNKYVVGTALSGGSLAINKPGNRVAWVDADPVAVGANYTGNFAFERNAIHLLTRLPKLPKEGTMGEHQVVTDPFSGISFMVSYYPGYHLGVFEVSVAWGVKAVKSEAIATLLG